MTGADDCRGVWTGVEGAGLDATAGVGGFDTVAGVGVGADLGVTDVTGAGVGGLAATGGGTGGLAIVGGVVTAGVGWVIVVAGTGGLAIAVDGVTAGRRPWRGERGRRSYGRRRWRP